MFGVKMSDIESLNLAILITDSQTQQRRPIYLPQSLIIMEVLDKEYS